VCDILQVGMVNYIKHFSFYSGIYHKKVEGNQDKLKENL
jgi:hypothetical protein